MSSIGRGDLANHRPAAYKFISTDWHTPFHQPTLIAGYIGQSIRLLAICDDCLNVAALDPGVLVQQHGPGFTTADLKPRLRCSRCNSRNTCLQVNGSPEGMMAGHVAGV